MRLEKECPMDWVEQMAESLVYEIVCIALPWDTVDDAWTARPRAWDAASIKGFMLELGPVSSLFDIVTFAVLFFVVCPAAVGSSWAELAAVGDVAGMAAFTALFQSGWFVESMWSQTLVIHMIRTPKLPFIQSHASAPVMLLTMTGIALLTVIPFSPLGPTLGLGALPVEYFLFLIPCILLYMALATSLKKAYVRRYGELL